jgi:hypothetical protein
MQMSASIAERLSRGFWGVFMLLGRTWCRWAAARVQR